MYPDLVEELLDNADELEDLVVGNGSASELRGNNATYTATITPAASGTVTVNIAAGAAQDGAGNPSAAADHRQAALGMERDGLAPGDSAAPAPAGSGGVAADERRGRTRRPPPTTNRPHCLTAPSQKGAALLRRRLFHLFMGVFARGRSLFGSFCAGTAPRTAPTGLFRAASPA